MSKKTLDTIDEIRKTLKEESEMQDGIERNLSETLEPLFAELLNEIKGSRKDFTETMEPLLSDMNEELRVSRKDTVEAIKAIRVPSPDVRVPEIRVPEIRVPEPRVTVNVPKIEMPDEMNIKGWVSLMGVDLNNPLPVQLRDAKGNPVKLFENLTQLISGGGSGGGKHDFFTIKGFSQSAYTELMNADGRLRVSVETGGSGLTDSELRATAVPVSQVSGANWSVNVLDAFGSTAVGSVFNADNRIRVSVETGGSGLTDSELRASRVYVEQVSGANWSTEVTSMPAVVVTSVTNSIASNLVDSSGVAYSGSNPVPVTGGLTDTQLRASSVPVEQVSGSIWSTNVLTMPAVVVTSITNSTAAALIDSSGAQYSGSNPVPMTIVSGALTSTISVGAVVSDAVDDGSAPIKTGGIARTANPTAVAGGDSVSASYDDLGRQIVRPVQARDLISTAYVSLTTGTETTLLAGVAGSYLDLIYIMGTNNSDAAVTVDIRAVTAGNVQTSIRIPANGTAGVALPVPIPQDATGNNWTADLPDITGSTITISALFTKEI